MDHTRRHYQKLLEFVQSGKAGTNKHDTTQTPFTVQGSSTDGELGFDTAKVDLILNNVPLTGDLKTIYRIIGNPDIEFYFGQWTLLSITKVKNMYETYITKNQTRSIDFALIYAGMGHCVVASFDPESTKIYYRADGGSNGYDREFNFNFACKYIPKEDELHDFTHWQTIISTEIEPFELPLIKNISS